MKVLLLFLSILASTLHARIGETPDQVAKRFGGTLDASLKFDLQPHYTFTYKQADKFYKIETAFRQGRCVYECYSWDEFNFSDDSCAKLLTGMNNGNPWPSTGKDTWQLGDVKAVRTYRSLVLYAPGWLTSKYILEYRAAQRGGDNWIFDPVKLDSKPAPIEEKKGF